MEVDFTRNPKQAEFVETVLCASQGSNSYRYICYGGGIRGGKTFAVLGTLIILCGIYPKSKWVIYRKDFPSLTDTTIPSLEKILLGNSKWKWHRDRSNFHVEFYNGSKIFFYGENISQDPDLNSMLGLECNGIVLEQVEELSEKLFQLSQSRIGSWYIDKMPKPLILMTLNPTQEWAKRVFYEPFREGKLEPPFHFITALPQDNPFVTEEQWEAWRRLDDRYKAQYIEGDWTDFDIKDNLWAFAFKSEKHIAKPETLELPIWKGDRNHPLYLSFDFNRNPITCGVIQHINNTIYVIESIKLNNSNIYALCDYITVNYPGFMYLVTGDATGRASTALVKDNLNYYTVILRQLRILPTQLKVPSINPKLEENQVLINSLLTHYSIQIHPEKGKALIYDFRNVRVSSDGGIEKKNRSDETQHADQLDNFRYYCDTFHRNFINLSHK